jgi:hypothetical protein
MNILPLESQPGVSDTSTKTSAVSQSQEQRVLTLERENLLLKKELEGYHSQSHHLSPRPPLATVQTTTKSQPLSQPLSQQQQQYGATESSSALSEQYDMLWTQTDTLQTTLKKFFAYQIEEDVMRQLVEQVSLSSVLAS